MKDVWLWLIHLVIFLWIKKTVRSEPQTILLDQGCSQYISTDVFAFSGNQNRTFNDLRRQLSNNTHFATAQQSGIYAMAQCRNYLSGIDCLACFDAAVSLTLNCSSDGGARVIFEGCFLRSADPLSDCIICMLCQHNYLNFLLVSVKSSDLVVRKTCKKVITRCLNLTKVIYITCYTKNKWKTD